MSGQQPVRVVHYINQFFAGIGGEDKAGTAPFAKDGSVGPGRLLEQSSQGAIKVAGTVVCGDNHFVENPEAKEQILQLISKYQPEGVVAGPAFAAGRYGEACTAIAQAVQEKLGIPVITGLAPESPSVEPYRQKLTLYRTGKSAADMKNSLPQMGKILVKLVRGEDLPEEDSAKLFPRGLKQNTIKELTSAERAIRMALAKFRGEPWQSEIPLVHFEPVPPAPPVKANSFRLALLTDGGLILQGNPEGMSSGRSKRWCRIGIASWDALSPDDVEVSHFGYDNRYVAADPNRLVPLDALRELERAGSVELHPYIYSTAGVATAIEDAARFGREIAEELKREGAQAAILTST